MRRIRGGLHDHLKADLQRRLKNDTVTILLRSLEMLSRVSKRERCRVFEEHRMVFEWIVTESWVRSAGITDVNQALDTPLSRRRRCSRWLYVVEWKRESDPRDRIGFSFFLSNPKMGSIHFKVYDRNWMQNWLKRINISTYNSYI